MTDEGWTPEEKKALRMAYRACKAFENIAGPFKDYLSCEAVFERALEGAADADELGFYDLLMHGAGHYYGGTPIEEVLE